MNTHELLKINVNDKTEKKNGMTYLSWAWAWTEILKTDPAATFEVKLWPDGQGFSPVMQIGDTGMVWVTTTVYGKSMTCQLPILDYKNRPISNPDSMAVNTAIMRCMVKSLALHGLGLYIYSGEDTPMEDDTKVVTVDTPAGSVDLVVDQSAPDNADEAAQLFADGMLAYIEVHRDLPDLNSYWKNNQVALDKLKISHPELYAKVRNGFAAYKKSLQEKKND